MLRKSYNPYIIICLSTIAIINLYGCDEHQITLSYTEVVQLDDPGMTPPTPDNPPKPDDPIKPDDPVKPEPPVGPDDPVKPEPPVGPDDPVKPEPPVGPDEPVEPPVGPDDPIRPDEPPTPDECEPGFILDGTECVEIICEPNTGFCCTPEYEGCENGGAVICNSLGTAYEGVPCGPARPETADICPSQCTIPCPPGTYYDGTQCLDHVCEPGTGFCCTPEYEGCENGGAVICNELGTAYEGVPCGPARPETADICPSQCTIPCPPGTYDDGTQCLEIVCEPNTSFCCEPQFQGCDKRGVVFCDATGTSYEAVPCGPARPETADICPSQCTIPCPPSTYYDEKTGECEPLYQDGCMTFIDSIMEEYVLKHSGWDTNHDGCLSPNEADAVTVLKTYSIGKKYGSFDTSLISTLDDLNKFNNLTHLKTYSIQKCNQLQTVTLKNIKSLETYSLDQDETIETLALPHANQFATYFADDLRNIKHLFLTAPGDFDYKTYSFFAITKDVRQSGWSKDWNMANKDVTLYLSRDKLTSATPTIESSTEWGYMLRNGSTRKDLYSWKAIYVCDDYATDISSCELVK